VSYHINYPGEEGGGPESASPPGNFFLPTPLIFTPALVEPRVVAPVTLCVCVCVRACVRVRALNAKRLELSTPKTVEI